jgi:hypothetical protein
MAEAVTVGTQDSFNRAKLTLDVTSVSTNSVSWSVSVTDNSTRGGWGTSGATLTVNVNGGNVLNEANKSYDFGGNTGSDTQVPNAFFPITGKTFTGTTSGLAAGTTYNINATFSAGTLVGTATVSFNFTTSTPPISPPVFSDSTVASSAIVGVAYSDGVSASNSPTYSVRNSANTGAGTLPAGLNLNTSTGAITGTPTTVGATSFRIRASNGGGTVDTGILTITVTSGGKVWNGTAFVASTTNVWNGTTFVAGVTKVWNGSTWVNAT